MEQNRKKQILELLNSAGNQTLNKDLEIIFTDVSEEHLSATMPVTPKVHQPLGILHGGASCVLAETLGSCLSLVSLDISKEVPVGTNLNTNHLRTKREGIVTGTATFIRKGNSVHVSQIEIRDENGELINFTTMTNNIVPLSKIN
ncbi:MAG: PaaI family thioesterase [Flavobacteriaceae bacterium]|jgi:1,4-dihydroxy-2-naphthoyl-CoA hydrolase|nr:PaaI family thioesterase [Flavobacteriaceae bacterium]